MRPSRSSRPSARCKRASAKRGSAFMQARSLWFVATLLLAHSVPAAAQSPAPPLSGQISAPDASALEGVLVSAQLAGSPITVTVVSDQNGRFAFPTGKLGGGHYALRIRATGYELDGAQSVDIADGKPAAVDLKLRKTPDLAAQLTNTEWFMSFPGTAEQKRPLIECMSCHTLERIARSKYDADTFMP